MQLASGWSHACGLEGGRARGTFEQKQAQKRYVRVFVGLKNDQDAHGKLAIDADPIVPQADSQIVIKLWARQKRVVSREL